MGFTKKTWKNRIAEYINRRLITMEDGSTNLVTVARDEGTISQEGDAFNAVNMNDLEDRIEAGFADVTQSVTNIDVNVGEDGKLHFVDSTGADTVIPFKNGKLKIWISYDYDGSFLKIDDATEIQMVIAFISTNAERCEGRVNCLYKEENGNIFKRYDTNDLNIVVNGNTFKFNNPWFGQSQKMNIFVYYK